MRISDFLACALATACSYAKSGAIVVCSAVNDCKVKSLRSIRTGEVISESFKAYIELFVSINKKVSNWKSFYSKMFPIGKN